MEIKYKLALNLISEVDTNLFLQISSVLASIPCQMKADIRMKKESAECKDNNNRTWTYYNHKTYDEMVFIYNRKNKEKDFEREINIKIRKFDMETITEIVENNYRYNFVTVLDYKCLHGRDTENETKWCLEKIDNQWCLTKTNYHVFEKTPVDIKQLQSSLCNKAVIISM